MFYPYPLESKKRTSTRTKKLVNTFLNNKNHDRTLSHKQWTLWLNTNDWTGGWRTRDKYIPRYGFVILTTEVISRLAGFMRGKRVLDSGAGSGYLTNCLRNRGINVTAIDDWSHSYGRWGSYKGVGSNIINCNVNDHDVSGYDIIVLSWPHDGMETVNKMVSGQYLIYQGEDSYGCTGSDDFHNHLDEPDQFEEIDSDFLNEYALRFDGIHDYWHIYRKV